MANKYWKQPGSPDYVLYSTYHRKINSLEGSIARLESKLSLRNREIQDLDFLYNRIIHFFEIGPHASAWNLFKQSMEISDTQGEKN